MSTIDMPEAVAKRLGYAIKMAQHALRVRMDETLRPLGLTMPQYAVMSALEAETGLSNARLARAAFVTPQTMQAVLANLERDGLIRRQPHPEHGRILETRLTVAGTRVLGRAHAAVRVVEEILLASFGAANAKKISASLSKCAEDLRSGRQEEAT